jgi:hypothetical protein
MRVIRPIFTVTLKAIYLVFPKCKATHPAHKALVLGKCATAGMFDFTAVPSVSQTVLNSLLGRILYEAATEKGSCLAIIFVLELDPGQAMVIAMH